LEEGSFRSLLEKTKLLIFRKLPGGYWGLPPAPGSSFTKSCQENGWWVVSMLVSCPKSTITYSNTIPWSSQACSKCLLSLVLSPLKPLNA
jgi:hypothetical protein